MALSREHFLLAATQLDCEVEAIMAVTAVESRGSGFNSDGTPVTLFEGHIFHRLTDGRYTEQYPTISYAKWTKVHYGRTWQADKERLNIARSLDDDAACQSASWGMFQIMGMNYKLCGFSSVLDFVAEMEVDENAHLAAFTQFVKNSGLADELRDKRWADFARRYNGPSYKVNAYDVKLARSYAKLIG